MKRLLALLVTLAFALPAQAGDMATPDGLISTTVQAVLTVVKRDKSILTDQPRLLALVDDRILPHFDFTRMTQLAVGRSWRTATPEQKDALVREFRAMLVRTYSKVFSNYPDPQVEVKPAQMVDDGEATVRTVIRMSDGRTAAVDYEMRKTDAGWKAFDVTVEGISLVTSYRGSFGDEIKQSGIDGLIAKLSGMNVDAGQAGGHSGKGKAN